ncbi:MAG: sulfite exporter TauE/SafE family protein [Bullifex sp.]|nr:sulfite exporter TauE/SafE family protein [Bullifex sp.]
MTPAGHLIFFTTCFVSIALQTGIGFGFPLCAMIVLPYLFPYSEALALTQGTALFSTLYLTLRFRKSIRWDVLIPVLIPAAAAGVLFTAFSFTVGSAEIRMMLGAALVLISVWFLAFASKVRITPKKSTGIIMGIISGAGSGLFGIGGPPAGLYLMPAIGDKTEYTATIQTLFSICNIINLSVRLILGTHSSSYLPLFAEGAVAVSAGTLFGVWVLKRIKTDTLAKAVYIFVGVTGTVMILQNLNVLK